MTLQFRLELREVIQRTVNILKGEICWESIETIFDLTRSAFGSRSEDSQANQEFENIVR
jgi:hypothetical protein